jgi:hypothetical protein
MITQTLTISSTGASDLEWTITEGSGAFVKSSGAFVKSAGTFVEGACSAPEALSWVAVSPTNGTTSPGNSDDVTVVFDATGLTPGDYTGELCITTNIVTNPEVVVELHLTVTQSDYAIYLPSIFLE